MSGPEALRVKIAECRDALAAIDAAWNGSVGNPCMLDRHRARRAVEDERIAMLRAAGWIVTVRWDGAAVSAAGIRSTSTCGPSAALNNWLKRAREKAAA